MESIPYIAMGIILIVAGRLIPHLAPNGSASPSGERAAYEADWWVATSKLTFVTLGNVLLALGVALGAIDFVRWVQSK